MTSYQVDPGPRSIAVGRFLDGVRRELLEAFLEECRNSGLTVQDLSLRLAKPCSELNGYFAGTRPLSLRSIADLAWALNRSVSFDIGHEKSLPGQNDYATGMTVHYCGSYHEGMPHELTTTAPPPPVIRIGGVTPPREGTKT